MCSPFSSFTSSLKAHKLSDPNNTSPRKSPKDRRHLVFGSSTSQSQRPPILQSDVQSSHQTLSALALFISLPSSNASHSTRPSRTHLSAPADSNYRRSRPSPARSRTAHTSGSRPCIGHSRRLCRRRSAPRHGRST